MPRSAAVPIVPVATLKIAHNANPVNRGPSGEFDCDWIHRAPAARGHQSGVSADLRIESCSRSSAGSMPTATTN
jgi:hypothetical protein